MPELLRLYPAFGYLIPYPGEITVIKYKSPLDTLRHKDFDTLRIYRLLTKKKYSVDKDHLVRAVSLASNFEDGYKQYLGGNGYGFKEVRKGTYGHEDDHRRYYWIDLGIIGREDPENMVNLFSSNFKRYSQFDRPNIRNVDIIAYIWQAIFMRKFGMMNDVMRKLGMMNNIEIRQLPEFTTSIEEMRKRFPESFPPEERLAGLKPEQILAGLNQDQIKKLKELINRS